MANPILTQLELPSGSKYDLVDAGARDLIAAINNWDYVISTNAANTPKGVKWYDGSTLITGTLVASKSTMYKIYLVPTTDESDSDSEEPDDMYREYITMNPSGSTYQWEKFGSIHLPDMSQYLKNKVGHEGDTAGDLAYKNTASGSVTVPKTFTTTTSTTVATTESKTVSVSGTTAGSVNVTKGTVEIVPSATGTAANKYTPAGSNESSSVSGTCSVTPSGSNESSSVSGSCTVTPSGTISVGSGTANYTPGGSVSVASAGSTTTIKNPTSKTVVTDMRVSDPSATQATGELLYYSVSGTTLSLKKIVETTGDSITTENKTVKTGDASYSFSGTGAELKFTGSSSSGSISGTAAAQKFKGSASSGTISGTAAAQKFNGTDTYLKTASEVATGASFTGASMTSTGSVSVPKTFNSESSTTTATTESKTVTVS